MNLKVKVNVITGNPRYDALLHIINSQGHKSVEELALLLKVSTQTIRRDITTLHKKALLYRFHGGASQLSSVVNQDILAREVYQIAEKKRIAMALVDRIPNRSAVFVSSGTTVEYVAKALENKKDLRIITTSLRVANILYSHPEFEVMVPGGTVRKQNCGITGASAQEFIKNFRSDFFIMSLGAIEPDGTILDFDVSEVALMRLMMANAKKVYAAVDSTKFSAQASVILGNVAELDVIFTDAPPPPPLAKILKLNKVDVVCC